jgi:hypothetical protein
VVTQNQQKMNKKIIYIVSVIAIILIASAVLLLNNDVPQVQVNRYADDNLLLKQKLAEHGISMSSPIKLQNPDDITQYCSFFTDEEKQKDIEYCTSTEIKDEGGKFLGNIHMVGSAHEPKIVMVLIQTDPFMSEIDSVKTIFTEAIRNLVCDCWQQVKPDNFENTEQWIEGLRQFHLSDTKPHSKSKQLELESKTVQLELTTNEDGYLWQLFIYK